MITTHQDRSTSDSASPPPGGRNRAPAGSPPRPGARRRGAALPALLVTSLLVGPAACSHSSSAAPRARPNVLVFLVDTLRADHLSCYGHDKPTSPVIDAFAAGATRFANAFAPAPVTVASHASLFSSTPPAVHGAWNRAGEMGEAGDRPALSPNARTLAEELAEAGWRTAAICDGGNLNKGRGLAQGFETFESKFLGVENRVDRAIEWLDEEADDDRPFFLFLHTYEVHTPWLPEEELLAPFDDGYQGPLRAALDEARAFATAGEGDNQLVDSHKRFFKPLLDELGAEDRAFVKAMYDAEIRKVDIEFARLLDFLESAGLADETIVVLTSDHGEEFGEHGRWEHKQIYEECLRVPLIVRLPGQSEGRVRSEPVELMDVMPTLLAELGLEVPETALGRVLDLHGPDEHDGSRLLWAEKNRPFVQVALRRGATKVLFHPEQEWRAEVFDLATDPTELADLSGEAAHESTIAEALKLLGGWRRNAAEHARKYGLNPMDTGAQELDASLAAELRALGYL